MTRAGETPGFQCPHCGSGNNIVMDSRSHPTYIRRRRRCVECDHRFTTAEVRITYDQPAGVRHRIVMLRDSDLEVMRRARALLDQLIESNLMNDTPAVLDLLDGVPLMEARDGEAPTP